MRLFSFIVFVCLPLTSTQAEMARDEVYGMDLRELLTKEIEIFSPGISKSSDAKSVPGIVSVITSEDIKRHGWRTLSDAILSIPGFSQLHNDDEYIYAPRGIYATTNQKVLVMRDSHVLNEPVLDLVHLDYSIALDSIDRIEVIRGPGASTYGNAAMGAVINIITRKGNYNNVSARVGDHGQQDIDVTFSKKADDYYYTLYGRYSNADGESREVSAAEDSSTQNPKSGTHVVGDFPNNYNLGFIAGKGGLSLSTSYQHDEMNIHWGLQGQNTTAASLAHEPKFELDSLHMDLKYEHQFSNKLSASFNHYYDNVDLFIVKNDGEITQEESMGSVLDIGWKAQKVGLDYIVNFTQSDELSYSAGINYEVRTYGENYLERHTATTITPIDFFEEGDDSRSAVYAQVDWQAVDWLKAVVGGRLDSFSDYDSSFNPRVALLFTASETISAKLIYTTAFQTPGFSYQNSVAVETGSIDALQPEELTSYQAVLRYENLNSNYYVQASYFNNHLDNLIQKPGAYRVNSGEFASRGIELEARTIFYDWDIRAFYTYLEPDSANIDELTLAAKVNEDEFKHIASDVVYISANYTLFNNLDFNLNSRYETGFVNNENRNEDSKMIFNSTLIAKDVFYGIDCSLSIYNLLDEQYEVGDTGLSTQPQQGRWFLVGVEKEF